MSASKSIAPLPHTEQFPESRPHMRLFFVTDTAPNRLYIPDRPGAILR